MRYASLPLLLLLALVGTATGARAQAAPSPGACVLGTAQADLDVNNVFARVFNTGSLFYGNTTTGGDGYLVPKASGRSPIFASGLWVGGQVGGELRVAGSRYDDFNFWPGPLGADGRPVNPASCDAYDRIYSVSRANILAYEGGGADTGDLLDWPYQLGAPVVDGDGNPDNYDLAAGDRPEIIGDQGLWWVMNDVGGPHTLQNTPPLGIEVQVLAFAFSRSDALGSTTFYRYRVINKSGTDITNTYLSVFADPDLGDATDDFVGSDVAAGLGYVYNADNTDGTGSGLSYGTPPPAMGYDFFQGPIVNGDTLGTSAFSYFENVASGPTSDPDTGIEIYNFQQGLWADGTPMYAQGNGYAQTGGAITKFAFPGDPVTNQPWSEVNPVTGTNTPGDRRFVVHTGPFTLNNGDAQDIVFGVVFAQGTSNLNSISALRAADKLAQTAYNANFQLAPPPPSPPLCQEGSSTIAPGSGNCLEAVELNGQATLVFGYPTNSSNYLGRFEVFDALLAGQGATDSTYNFEGFNIYRYPNSNFEETERELVATYDIANGITTVIDNLFDPVLGDLRPFVVARGTDSGIQYTFNIQGLTNFTDYYYGVSAYAVNEESVPKVNESSPTQITIRPSRLTGGVDTQSALGDTVAVAATQQIGEGSVAVRVVDPTRVTGNNYEVRFFVPTEADGSLSEAGTTYSIVNTTTGQTVLDGQAYYAQSGQVYPQGTNVAVVDGFTFDILGPAPGFKTFLTVSNGAGVLNPPEYAAVNGPSFPAQFPNVPGLTVDPNRPTAAQQVGPGTFLIHQGANPADTEYFLPAANSGFFNRVTRDGGLLPAIGANDYEWRFTGSSIAYRAFTDGGFLTVPFELWDIGTTPNDPSDDVRLLPWMLPNGGSASAPGYTPNAFDLSNIDHAISTGTNDPVSDVIYWHRPVDDSPGQAGYNAFAAAVQADTYAAEDPEVFARMALVSLNGGAVTNPAGYNQQLPEPGTVFRIVTLKPNQPGDTFAFSTAGLERTTADADDMETAMDRIAAVPNPYFGTSNYETGNLSRVIRFTNLPEQAVTIRIFTVSGSLIQTLRKEGSDRSLDWNLETSNNLPVASGMYLAHVDIEGVGERTLKLGIVNRRTQITVF